MILDTAYFRICLALGSLLRSARYSNARIVDEDGERRVRKHRSFYAPVLVWLGSALFRILDTGVRVLPQRDWQARERQIYRSLHGVPIRVDADGTLVLPCFEGATLSALLEDPVLDESVRKKAIEAAVVALAEFHHLGFTHGDAMAENALIDPVPRPFCAHWFDFETVHDSNRPIAWRRADDVRALMVSCLVRTNAAGLAEIFHLILDVYADEEVTRYLALCFNPVRQRPLPFHLAQAGLSIQYFGEIARLLSERLSSTAGKSRPGSHLCPA